MRVLSVSCALPALLGMTGVCSSQEPTTIGEVQRQELVIRANRTVPDEEVTRHVEEALANDPWIYSEHVSVTTRGGVVILEGVAADSGELLRMLRLAHRIHGARRVIDRIEINAQLPDGG